MMDHHQRVYAIAGAGKVKIGRSFSPEARLRGLRAGCPVPLELLAQEIGDHKREAELHQLFSEYRLHGEWFTLSDPILDWIARNAA